MKRLHHQVRQVSQDRGHTEDVFQPLTQPPVHPTLSHQECRQTDLEYSCFLTKYKLSKHLGFNVGSGLSRFGFFYGKL